MNDDERLELIQKIDSLSKELNFYYEEYLFYKSMSEVLIEYVSEDIKSMAKAKANEHLLAKYNFDEEVRKLIKEYADI